MPITLPLRRLQQTRRAFSTTTFRPINLQWQNNDPEALADALPPYPHGPTRWFKQSRLGLYGGACIQFGNNVSPKTEIKTRRTWHPNVVVKRLFSRALNRSVQVRVTSRVLRTVDKLGGLDEYLLGEKEGRVRELGESGWWLRWAIMQTPAVKRRFALERRRLGLVEPEVGGDRAVAVDIEAVDEAAAEDRGVHVSAPNAASATEETLALPPVRFRVAPKQHLVLTPNGWRRVREDPSRRLNKRLEIFTGRLKRQVNIGRRISRKPEAKRILESVQRPALRKQMVGLRQELKERGVEGEIVERAMKRVRARVIRAGAEALLILDEKTKSRQTIVRGREKRARRGAREAGGEVE